MRINNLEYYRVFYYVAKFGSLTLAGQELNISQPAVSQSIKQLEQQLEISLFSRISRGVKLTDEGATLFHYVEKGYELFELGEQNVWRMKNLEAGEVKIGASDMTLQFYLLPFLERFHEKYPGVKVIVTNVPTPKTLTYLEEGRIDFGIVSTPFTVKQGVESFQVREIEDIFVAGRRFIAYKNKMLDLQELEQLPVIMLENNTSSRRYMDQFLKENNVRIQPEFELATSDMIVQFTLRNLGVGNIVRDFAQRYIDDGTLFELRFNKRIPKRHFCVVKSEKNAISHAAEELIQLLN